MPRDLGSGRTFAEELPGDALSGRGERPIIQIGGGKLPRLVDEAENALLAHDRDVYQRGDFIVRPALVQIPIADERSTIGLRLVSVSLRNVGELEVPEEVDPVLEPEPSVPAVRPCAPKDQDADAFASRPWLAPLVVRPRQACEMLSIGLTRLYELLNEGALESYLHGGSRRITIASIHAYIDRNLTAGRTT
jgi:excisionase family DNA binding protein